MTRNGLGEAALPGLAPAEEAGPEGHRARLRARFDRGGAAALADYEMLELVLFAAIPRRDVKPIAKALIREFGSYAAVLAAPVSRLRAVEGMGEAAARQLKIVEAAAHLLAQGRVMNRRSLASFAAVADYLRAVMGHLDHEETRLLFLDRKNALIADERHGRGTVDHAPIYPREVAKRALELGASALVMAHNHPSGDPTPSQADIETTKRIRAALDAVGVTLHDHLVIGRDGEASFRALGLI